jgi:hypothetical protein
MTKKIVADAHGFYDAELPGGLYTMTAQASAEVNPSYRPFEKYHRPVFRVGTSSDPIIIDITLYPKRICDADGQGAGLSQEQLGELWADACGGEDSFDIASQSGAAFQLYIRFLRRSSASPRREYGGGRVAAPDIFEPVRVEYNLVSLNAERVIYDPEQQTVDAQENVVLTDESGKPEKAEHMILHLSNGRAIRLH